MILPENKNKEVLNIPKHFLVWGQSMSGKTYLARKFPNPLILNTDGNGDKIPEPTIEITDFKQFVEAIEEIEKGNHTFETIVIDLVDDIATMMEVFVCEKNSIPKVKYESIAEIPFGKGYVDCKNIWKALMMRLSQMKYNIVYISHVLEKTVDDVQVQQPSLEQKYLNMTKGRCDAYIKCAKIGTTYIQKCEEKRDLYNSSDIKDATLKEALKDVKMLFEDLKTTPAVAVKASVATDTKEELAKPMMVKKN